ncbi:hypothetical protein [Gaoshiqia sediminis]|uniref:PKD domain-containing protein n=1 Tax=Gaoshiqia sediminis TaxID=2986998 RepID=A0AA42C7V6_9BACT|nr:hypothetical protein [Gaoshiqia sediminis]MCW0483949.1 hypothetical protein [Gaoshiqia sediminis]
MNKKLIYSMLVAATILVACDPAEDRDVMSGAITAADLDISATPQLVEGKNSNYVELNSDGVGCLTSWDYGNGITTKTKSTVQLVLKGANEIIFTGLNGDGTTITKTLTVQVDTLINVPEEWGLLCGSGEKKWVWDETANAVWGNGGYMGCDSPCWWTNDKASMDENDPDYGANGFMLFSVKGAKLTKSNETGSNTMSGSFTFDMTQKTMAGDAVWAKGKLFTKNVTVLAGKQPNHGNAPVYEYDILKLTEDKMSLAWPEPGSGSWGTAWFWMFRSAD